MAGIQDRRRDFYSQKQSVRDEASAPLHIESAGDVFIREQARRQADTKVTLEGQLAVQKEFQPGSSLQPCLEEGLTSPEHLEQVRRTSSQEGRHDEGSGNKDLGLSRRELELVLAEKPNSDAMKLLRFALSNKKEEDKTERLPDHPMNRLKEIEEEAFGHLKPGRDTEAIGSFHENNLDGDLKEGGNERRRGRKRSRRRRKGRDLNIEGGGGEVGGIGDAEEGEVTAEQGSVKRPSLWDVKDMKAFCRPREVGCKEKTLYTIREGKIVKLEDVKPP